MQFQVYVVNLRDDNYNLQDKYNLQSDNCKLEGDINNLRHDNCNLQGDNYNL